jgi:thiol-disulfide isomerase/thioredoxin
MTRRTFFSTMRGCLAMLIAVGSIAISARAADELKIGSTAPELNVEHWVQNGEGKFKPVTKFENDKVYVVEFWATWCGPCIASMPHIVEIQKNYGDKGVQIVSISDEDLETVEGFLEKEVKKPKKKKGEEEDTEETESDEPLTYRELTKSYCLKTDPDGSSSKDYMEAAGQNGIPCAFIVGKDQKIEWIGHPMSMDDVLAAVVDGKWDRDAYAEKMKEEEARRELLTEIQNLIRRGKTAKALAKIDNVLEADKYPKLTTQLKVMRIQILLQDEESVDKLATAVPEALKEFADKSELVNLITWSVYEKTESGDLDDKSLVKSCRIAAQQAAEKAPEELKAAILDTVAHLQFVEGDFKGALATQEMAVKLVDKDSEMAEGISEFLEKIQEELKKSDK